MTNTNYENKYVILRDTCWDMDEEKIPELRVYQATGGFGCSPTSIGQAVFAVQIATDLDLRLERYQIDRLATKAEVKAALDYKAAHPPKTFTIDDVTFVDGRAKVLVKGETLIDVELQFSGTGVHTHFGILNMTSEGLMNMSLGFVVDHITDWLKKKQPVNHDEVKSWMVEFAKGWALKYLFDVLKLPPEIKVNVDTLSPEQVKRLESQSKDYQRALLGASPDEVAADREDHQ